MRTKILLSVGLLFTASAMTAEERSDTIAQIEKPIVVRIISSPDKKRIIVEGREGQPDYNLDYESSVSKAPADSADDMWAFNLPFAKNAEQNKLRRRNNSSFDALCDVYAGGVIPTEADRGFSRAGWEIGVLNAIRSQWHLSRCGTDLSLGLGIQYRSFNIGDGMILGRSDAGRLTLMPVPEEYDKASSKLHTFSLQIPLTLSQKIYKAFTIEVGGVAMLNTYTTGSCKWKIDNVESQMSVKNLHQRLLTVDALARIGWRDCLAFYVRYSPMSQFKPHHGPQYDSVAIGMSLGF